MVPPPQIDNSLKHVKEKGSLSLASEFGWWLFQKEMGFLLIFNFMFDVEES